MKTGQQLTFLEEPLPAVCRQLARAIFTDGIKPYQIIN